MSDLLGKDAILGAQDLETEDVAVPEWGGTVRVRALMADERDAWEESWQGVDAKGNATTNFAHFRAKLVARCVVDEKGERVFSDQDVEALGKKSAAALQRLFNVACRLSALTKGDLKELEKNSGGGLPG